MSDKKKIEGQTDRHICDAQLFRWYLYFSSKRADIVLYFFFNMVLDFLYSELKIIKGIRVNSEIFLLSQ